MKKLILLILVTATCFSLIADKLGIFVDSNRFFGEEGKNEVEINYSIPYKNIEFIKLEYGYEAEILVDIEILLDDKLVIGDAFTNKLILTDASKIYSDLEYLDKISISLPEVDLQIKLEFVDVNTEKSLIWTKYYTPLNPSGLVSDLELSSYIKKDSTNFQEKFHRAGFRYNVIPNHTFQKELGNIAFYHELRNLFRDNQGNYNILQEIIIKSGETVIDSISNQYRDEYKEVLIIEDEIDIGKLEEGHYNLIIRYYDQLSGIRDEITDYFSIKSRKAPIVRMFIDIEDEIKLVSYFMNTNQKKVIKTLTEKGIENYISKFWISKDPDPSTSENEFLEQIKDRISDTNKHYAVFKDGWETDMGRIYIKFGNPYELRKLSTEMGSHEFSEKIDNEFIPGGRYTEKNYEIWKYRLKKNANYIFVDLLANGNYKLIYSSDDNDGETTLTDWERYLGSDFDIRLLE